MFALPWTRRSAPPARPARRYRPLVEALEDRHVPSTFFQATNLVADQPGAATVTDPNLVNGWGIAVAPSGNFWVSSNGKDVSTLYNGDVGGKPINIASLVVSIPGG